MTRFRQSFWNRYTSPEILQTVEYMNAFIWSPYETLQKSDASVAEHEHAYYTRLRRIYVDISLGLIPRRIRSLHTSISAEYKKFPIHHLPCDEFDSSPSILQQSASQLEGSSQSNLCLYKLLLMRRRTLAALQIMGMMDNGQEF
ncbi:hypothetical protein ABKN59_006804 [Abortiporus biennis]